MSCHGIDQQFFVVKLFGLCVISVNPDSNDAVLYGGCMHLGQAYLDSKQAM